MGRKDEPQREAGTSRDRAARWRSARTAAEGSEAATGGDGADGADGGDGRIRDNGSWTGGQWLRNGRQTAAETGGRRQ